MEQVIHPQVPKNDPESWTKNVNKSNTQKEKKSFHTIKNPLCKTSLTGLSHIKVVTYMCTKVWLLIINTFWSDECSSGTWQIVLKLTALASISGIVSSMIGRWGVGIFICSCSQVAWTRFLPNSSCWPHYWSLVQFTLSLLTFETCTNHKVSSIYSSFLILINYHS